MSRLCAVGSAPAFPASRRFYAATAPEIEYSDCVAPTFLPDGSARFSRPILDAIGHWACAPGARIRFNCTAGALTVRLRYNLVSAIPARESVGVVLVNGESFQTFTTAISGVWNSPVINVEFGSPATRLVEVLLPYGDSVDFCGAEIDAGFELSTASARPSTQLAVYGDSITEGFFASDVSNSWATKLGIDKGWQVVNMGFATRGMTAADGAVVGALLSDRVIDAMSFNDFNSQIAVATFKDACKTWVSNVRAANPGVPIYVLTPFWTNVAGAIPIESYRQAKRDAVSELALAGVSIVEGAGLATNSTSSFPDGVHPNDAGHAELAATLAPLVS